MPNISNKLIKREERTPLTQQHKFWDIAIDKGFELRCLYTNDTINKGDYDLDHFIPWSFVSHDLLWNLIPINPNVNSSKSNKLPDLKLYLPKLAQAHQKAVEINLEFNNRNKLLEDYLSLGYTPQDIVNMNKDKLIDCFYQTFSPLHQIALNMGFENWKY